MRLFLLLCGMLLALMASAHARMHAGPVAMDGGRRLKATAVQQGMTTSLAAAYSFRKVRDAYAGSAVKLRRTTGGTQDIGFTAAGDFDTAAATAFCLATTCFLDTWYDQSTNARHATQPTAANQPQFIFNCVGAQPCARSPAGGFYLQSASVTWASAISSFSAVGMRSAGTASCWIIQKGTPNSFGFNNAANQWVVTQPFVTAFPLTAADNAWHAGVGIIAGAGSLGRIDATEIAGVSTAGSAAAGTLNLLYSEGGDTCSITEAILWDGYALTLAERQALTENQRQYWTPLPLDTFATPAAAYSMRKLQSSYSGPAIRLRRASDNAEQDINFLSFTGFTGAPIDTAAANAHCAATTCSVVTWYDQSGSSRHLTMATAGTQPAYVADCGNSLPCMRSAGGQNVQFPTITPAGAQSFSVVARVDGAAQTCVFANAGNNRLISSAGTTWISDNGAGAQVEAAAALATWHAGVSVLNGAASGIIVDGGTEVTGTVAVATTVGTLYAIYDPGANPCSQSEMVYWNGYALTANERTVLIGNQRSFWGF